VFGFLRRIVKPAITLPGRLHRANRTAVNFRRGNSNKKHPVKSAIAGEQCFVAGVRIFCHEITLTRIAHKNWPFSDIELFSLIRPKMARFEKIFR
jgi:hypothetical protein